MLELADLVDIAGGRSVSGARQVAREVITAEEHETIVLPDGILRDDGSLDVYDDVLKLFRPTYKKNRPAIQCLGWVGYIPLNDKVALDVRTRVPVDNLERLIVKAEGYEPNILRKYTRQFAQALDRPDVLLDVLADQLLDAFEHIWRVGLLKTYKNEKNEDCAPTGRIHPYASAIRSRTMGRPSAVSSSFRRTADFGPNRLIRYAFEKLLARYAAVEENAKNIRRERIKLSLNRLDHVNLPTASEISPHMFAANLKYLPLNHEHYADALMIAQIITFDAGLSIRGVGSAVSLPSILIDMADVFERYIRNVLIEHTRDIQNVIVKDGNKGGHEGAKVLLYEPIRDGLKSPYATPDILIETGGTPRLIADVKYKPSIKLPDRADLNQIVLYGARYASPKVMVLHAERPKDRGHVELCGRVGQCEVYIGMIDLESDTIEVEEADFARAVVAML